MEVPVGSLWAVTGVDIVRGLPPIVGFIFLLVEL